VKVPLMDILPVTRIGLRRRGKSLTIGSQDESMTRRTKWPCWIVLGLIMEMIACQRALSAPPGAMSATNISRQCAKDFGGAITKVDVRQPTGRLYHNRRIYRQNRGMDPFGWALSGPALDAAATQMNAEYYRSYNFNSAPRNYIYYDWGW